MNNLNFNNTQPDVANVPVNDEILVSAILSHLSYINRSKGIGEQGINHANKLTQMQEEQLRHQLIAKKSLSEEQLVAVEKGFWKDDLLQIALKESVEKLENPNKSFHEVKDVGARELMALNLWASLFVNPVSFENFNEKLAQNANNNALSELLDKSKGEPGKYKLKDLAGMSEDGFMRADRIHSLMFAKVWDSSDGFNNKKSFVITRGTENAAKAEKFGAKTFSEYLFGVYKNFNKGNHQFYKDAVDTFIQLDQTSSNPSNQIIFAGHSLGGAETTANLLAQKETLDQLNIKTQGYTFGSPAVGEIKVGNVASAALGLGGALLSNVVNTAVLLGKKIKNLIAPSALGESSPVEVQASNGMTNLARKTFYNKISQPISNMAETVPLETLAFWGAKEKPWLKPQLEEKLNQENKVINYAHEKDLIGFVGEALGFKTIGQKFILKNNPNKAAIGLAEHDMGKYIKSMESLIRQSGQPSEVMNSLEVCRQVVDQLLDKQMNRLLDLQKYASAQESYLFVRSQLGAVATFNEAQAPSYLREPLTNMQHQLGLSNDQLLLQDRLLKEVNQFKAFKEQEGYRQKIGAPDFIHLYFNEKRQTEVNNGEASKYSVKNEEQLRSMTKFISEHQNNYALEQLDLLNKGARLAAKQQEMNPIQPMSEIELVNKQKQVKQMVLDEVRLVKRGNIQAQMLTSIKTEDRLNVSVNHKENSNLLALNEINMIKKKLAKPDINHMSESISTKKISP